MSRESSFSSNKQFYQVVNGEFVTKVPETHERAVPRINKKNVQVFEKHSKALYGLIEHIEFEDGDFGKQVKLTLDKNDEGKNPILSFQVESKNGRDVLKQLPGVDFTKEVRIMPYKFTPEGEDDEISGISIAHRDDEDKFTQKVGNFFFNPATKKYLHKFPVIDWDLATEADKKIYKIQRDVFLVNYITENVIPNFSAKEPLRSKEEQEEIDGQDGIEYPGDGFDYRDIPFD